MSDVSAWSVRNAGFGYIVIGPSNWFMRPGAG